MSSEGGTGPTSLDKSGEQLAAEIGLTEEEIAWRKAFVGFDTEDQERMAKLGAVVSAQEEQLVEAFLESIYTHDRTREIVEQSPRGKDGLRRVVEEYLETLTGGTYDREYYTQRCRIGRIHDQLDMPLHHFGGMFGNLATLFLEEIEANTVERARNAAESGSPDAVEAAIEEGFADAMAATRCINLDMQVVNDTYESRRRELREAINLIPDPVFETNRNGEFLLANEATAELFDRDPDDLIGKTPDEAGAGEVELWDLERETRAVIESGEPKHNVEKRLTTASGEPRTFEVSQMPHRVGVTSQFSVLVYARDITDRKEQGQSLERQQTFFENTSEIVVLFDDDGVAQFQNHRGEHLPGPAALDIVGKDPADLVHPDDREQVAQTLETVLEEPGEVVTNELRTKMANGEWRWHENRFVNLLEDSAVDGILMSSRDITDRKRQEKHLETAQEVANLGWWQKDISSDRIYWSERVYDMWGIEDERGFLDHERFLECIHPDDVAQVDKAWNAAFEGEPYDIEHRIVTPDGETRWMRQRAEIVFEDGNAVSATGIVQDITDRKEREQELERARELVEKTQENASIGWWEVDLVEDTLHWSDEVYRIHDLAVDQEVKLEDGIEFYHPEDRATIRRALETVRTEGEPYDLELRIVTAADRVRWIRTVADPLYDDDGEVVSILGIFQDITDRKDREEKLRQFREAVEATAHAVYITDSDGTIEYVNSAFESITGFSSDEAIGRSARLLKSGEHDHDFYEEFWETLESGERWESEMIDRKADGDKIVLNQTIAPITDDDGVPVKYVAVAQDITSRKQYEKQLEETREELRQIIDLVPDLVFVKNRDGEYLMANEATANAYGLTSSDIEGQHEADILPSGSESEKFREADLEVIESGDPKVDHEETLTTADGETKVLQTTKIPYEVPGSGEDAVLGYARDVTELKEYETRLEGERDFLDSVIESLPFPFYVIDVEDYTVEYANSNAEVSEGTTCHAVTHRRDQPCDEGDDPIDCPLSTVVETGDSAVVEHVHYDEEGNERTYQVHASPIFDEEGELTLMAESNIDITERVQYERQIEQQRDNLQLLNKIVRHDIRNDLQLVLAYAETLEAFVEEDGEEYIRQVLEAAREAVDITTTAREVTEVLLQQGAERSPVGLRRVLENEIDGIRSSNEKAVVAVENSLPQVEVLADDMLESVFRNLLSNAIVHNDAEVPEITVGATVSGDVAQVRIADNGPGIPDDQKERIFEEGETGLDSGGTGLGLYLVQTLIDRYRGDVWVEDRAGRTPAGSRPQPDDNDPRGSVFVVEIPLADS
ncbi:PAS domain S-box protein [Natrarchaeobaculum aegyptiacum]|uniref:histidine kinase n=1 Tax=Natrarchaeobaculum aegyptiacum TaxID=745377 RepID=A0A2Z2HVG8_9EURY|nr:PAS domain S-box protein [Natrarchaeobaculum aegyptiacum]ARS91211.1 hypothetical protein B1756_16740 [Natrarchaeobaculum aegyptiacum]